MSSNTPRGFTLVELLVVIAIIGVLVGLLIPAVNYAREAGRKAECLSSLRGVGQALVQYESDKGSFPGRIERLRFTTGDDAAVSWMIKLLPYLEQGNVLEKIQTQDASLDRNGDGLIDPIEIEIVTCPSDPPTGETSFRLSYVINCGTWDRDNGDSPGDWSFDLPANGIAHARYSTSSPQVNLGYVAKNDGATNTLLSSESLSAVSWMSPSLWQNPNPENTRPDRWDLEEGLHGMVWTLEPRIWLKDQAPPDADRQYAFNSPFARSHSDVDLLNMDWNVLVSFARPSSNHPGGVNAIFCDAHAKFIRDDIDPWVYNQLMSVSNAQARHLRTGMNWRQQPVSTQVDYQLSEGAY